MNSSALRSSQTTGTVKVFKQLVGALQLQVEVQMNKLALWSPPATGRVKENQLARWNPPSTGRVQKQKRSTFWIFPATGTQQVYFLIS